MKKYNKKFLYLLCLISIGRYRLYLTDTDTTTRYHKNLKLCGRSGRNCLLFPPVLSGYNGSPDTRFSRGTTQLTSLPDGERCLRPPQSLVVSLLLSLVSTLVFSRTGGVLSLRSNLTHRFPQFPLRNLSSLVMLAVSSLVFAAMDTAFF